MNPLWWLTPRGRIQWALRRDWPGTDRLRRAARDLERRVDRGEPWVRPQLCQVLARLIRKEIQQRDFFVAGNELTRLDDLSLDPGLVASLRWELVEALRGAGLGDQALRHAQQHIYDPHATTDQLTELLLWALTWHDPQRRREFADAVTIQAGPLMALKMLCLMPAEAVDPLRAKAFYDLLEPRLLAPWPRWQGEAHLRRAMCAEVCERPADMLAEATNAVSLCPDDEQARYWLARAQVWLGNGAAAMEKCTGRQDERWLRLSSMARALAHPSLDEARTCLETVKGSLHDRRLLAAALQPALSVPADGPQGEVIAAGELAQRLAEFHPAPWALYQAAIGHLRAGRFAVAAKTLAYEVIAPDDGWPVPMLRAVCAAVAGDAHELQFNLAVPTSIRYEDDRRVLAFIFSVLCALSDADNPHDVDPDDVQPGPVTRAIPELSGLLSLLKAVPGTPPPLVRTSSAWSRWLLTRLSHTAADITALRDVMAHADAEADADEHELRWEHWGSLQDLRLPVINEIEKLGRFSGWDVLARQRLALAAAPSGPAFPVPPGDRPPGSVGDVLKTLVRLDSAVERCYLTGRLALRAGMADAALDWFQKARPPKTASLPGRLVMLRFEPLLSYWEGVALAHLSRFDEAELLLSHGMRGTMAPQAHAQAGLIAFARGHDYDAHAHLQKVGAHRPPAAMYLAGLIAQREGRTEAAQRLLAELNGDSVYVPATDRLLGRICESQVELKAAREYYRRALLRWPGEQVATVGYNRVLLRERYEAIRNGVRLETGALIGDLDDVPAMVRDLFELADGDVTAADRAQRATTRPALRRLVVSALAVAGLSDRAADIAQASAAAQPALADIAGLLRVPSEMQALCLAAGQADAHVIEGLRGPGSSYSHQFWRAVGGAVTEPDTAAQRMADFTTGGPAEYIRLAQFFQLFAEDTERRRVAASVIWGDEDAALSAKCLAACILGYDRELLALYALLDLSELPCQPADIFCAASLASLRMGDVDAVAYGEIPEALADLSDPAVRQVMVSAFARRAVRDSETDPRSAQRDVDQALDLLNQDGEDNDV